MVPCCSFSAVSVCNVRHSTRKTSGVGVFGSKREVLGDLLDLELSLSNIHNKLKRVVILELYGLAVDVKEHNGCKPAQPFVPIDKGVIADERVKQGCSLEFYRRVGVRPEDR